jgi:hypothetical protein
MLDKFAWLETKMTELSLHIDFRKSRRQRRGRLNRSCCRTWNRTPMETSQQGNYYNKLGISKENDEDL